MTASARSWEAQLDTWHDAYRRERHALILRCHPPVRVLGKPRSGRFLACWDGTGPPDYAGVVGGRAVVFDAKDCHASRWPLKDLALHQARDLSATEANGGTAFLALQCPDGRFVLPWRTVGPLWWAWKRGESPAASVIAAEVGIPMGADGWIGVLS